MGKADTVACEQLRLILEAALALVPTYGSSAGRAFRAGWDGYKAPAVSDVRIDRCGVLLHRLDCCHTLAPLVIAVANHLLSLTPRLTSGAFLFLLIIDCSKNFSLDLLHIVQHL